MPLSTEEVNHIAHLARLNLTGEEITLYREQLSAILDYAASLQQVDTTGIPATSSLLPDRANLRDDEPQPGLQNSKAMQNAARVEDRQFKVPPVLDR